MDAMTSKSMPYVTKGGPRPPCALTPTAAALAAVLLAACGPGDPGEATSPGAPTAESQGALTGATVASGLIAREQSTGKLWHYPATGLGAFGARVQIGTGWGGMDRVIGAEDFDGDGRPDLLAREKSSGKLLLYSGTSTGGLANGRQVGQGWQGMAAIVGPGDLTGDGKADVVAMDLSGRLLLYPGNGQGGFLASSPVGANLPTADLLLAAGDFDGDGRRDLIAREKGTGVLRLLSGNGVGGVLSNKVIGNGWTIMDAVVGVGDFDGDGAPDLLARERATGAIWLYPGNCNGGFLIRKQVGQGWGGMDLLLSASSYATGVGNIDDLAPRKSSSTASSVTPMGTKFEQVSQQVITAANRAYLSDPAQSPPIPTSTQGLHLAQFPVNLFPHGSPSSADANQHAIGDCLLVAALASMAYVAPEFLASLITDRHDGTFTVAMRDPKGNPITVAVNSTFLADSGNALAAVAGKGSVADWATVLEKAVMKYIAVFKIVSDIGGIGSEHVLPMLTGQGASFAFDRGVLKPAQVTRAVKYLLAHGQFITGGFGVEKKLGAIKTLTGHGYTVLVPATGPSMTSMRNAWGMSPTDTGYDASADGVIDLPSTTDWAATLDLRVIAPGAAGAWGVREPYVPVTQ